MVVTDSTPGSLGPIVVAAGLVLLVPIENASDEGRDESGFGFGGGDGLVEAEEEGHVAVNAFLLEDLGGLNALPGGGELDEDAIARDAGLVVQGDDRARFGDGLIDVVGEAGVDLGGDAAGDDVEDLAAEGNFERPEGLRGDLLVGGAGICVFADLLEHVIDDGLVFGLFGCGGDEGRVGGRVLRAELLDGVEVAGIGDDGGVMPRSCSRNDAIVLLLRLLLDFTKFGSGADSADGRGFKA